MPRNPTYSPSLSVVGTQILQVLFILGLATTIICRLTQASKFSRDYVADPLT